MMLPLIVEPAELLAHLTDGNILVVDLCQAEKYRAAHIPGAVHLDTADLVCGIKPAIGKLPAPEKLSAVFARIGLQPDVHVVCYDDEGGPWAGRLIWTLDVIGHSKYSFLNGGKTAWIADGLPLETGENLPVAAANCQVSINNRFISDMDAIRSHLGDRNFLVWDARSRDEYIGTRLQSARGGHIPGAIHCEWTELLDAGRGLRLRHDLAAYLAGKGITPDKQIVTHCQTHRRSGLTYLAAKSLGYPQLRAYPGSWAEWGNCEDVPVTEGENP
ncbi:MAG TPA: rhodanese-like domain-containing protein [Pseudomonadales bacterium]|nr:rhodanese-like domain-containing protein [Pseudomonadales bacterium]